MFAVENVLFLRFKFLLFILQKVLSYVPFVIENEFDWPMLSSSTGMRVLTNFPLLLHHLFF